MEMPRGDREEEDADRYALNLLLGTPEPVIQTNISRFNSTQLAQAVLEQGPPQQMEPGTLALCLGFAKGVWPTAIGELRYIYSEEKPVWQEVNRIAERQLDLASLSDDSADYLRKVMGIGDD